MMIVHGAVYHLRVDLPVQVQRDEIAYPLPGQRSAVSKLCLVLLVRMRVEVELLKPRVEQNLELEVREGDVIVNGLGDPSGKVSTGTVPRDGYPSSVKVEDVSVLEKPCGGT